MKSSELILNTWFSLSLTFIFAYFLQRRAFYKLFFATFVCFEKCVKLRRCAQEGMAKEQTVLICEGCHNKVPHTGWFEQQKFVVSQFWGLETYS